MEPREAVRAETHPASTMNQFALPALRKGSVDFEMCS